MNRKLIQFRSQRHEHTRPRSRSDKGAEVTLAVVLAAGAGALLWAEHAGKLPPQGSVPIY